MRGSALDELGGVRLACAGMDRGVLASRRRAGDAAEAVGGGGGS